MPNIRPLSEKLQLKAINELHEVPSRLDEDIAALRTWIEKQPHLNARTDDQFLVTFLRGCKFSLEKAKVKIDKYYTLRTVYEKQLTCRNVEDQHVRDMLALGVTLILPKPLGEDGPKIMMFLPGRYSTDQYNMGDIATTSVAMQEIMLREDDNVVVSGYVQITDFTNATTAHFFQLSPSLMKKFSTFSEDALPLRLKSQHCINVPSGFEVVFNAFKPLMSQKMQKRLYLHGSNLDSFYECVPQKYLPKEYGGENGSIEEIVAHWCKRVQDHAQYYKDDAQYRTNEALRVGKPVQYDNVFGVEGSFRKLDFD